MSPIIDQLLQNRTLENNNLSQIYAAIYHIYSQAKQSRAQTDDLKATIDNFVLSTHALLILLMQAGFAFLESSAVHSKNVMNTLFYNFMNVFLVALPYWAVGYAFAFGEPCNGFIGYNNFFGAGLTPHLFSHWFFHYTLCATCVAIVSAALLERTDFRACIVFTVVFGSITFPMISHWAWHHGIYCDGWLAYLEYQDYAGSGVVHVTGGFCALMACFFIGPRHGRFPKSVDDVFGTFPGHNLPMTVLGGFLLTVGLLAFAGGDSVRVGESDISVQGMGSMMMNTVIGGSVAAVLVAVMTRFLRKKLDVVKVVYGMLAGMVSIRSGGNTVYPWAAFLMGAIGAMLFYGSSALVRRLKIDDPIEVVSVHLVPGIWGTIATALFDKNDGILLNWDEDSFLGLLYNLVGLAFILGWCLVTILPVLLLMKWLGWLNVGIDTEIKGLDEVFHGVVAYPEEQQYKSMLFWWQKERVAHGASELRNRMSRNGGSGGSAGRVASRVWSAGVEEELPNVPTPTEAAEGNGVANGH